MNVINKTNKYLLENYPLIWNTRLVWMISVNILVHLLFFSIGFSSANNLEDLKNNYSLNSFFFVSSAIYYNFLISIFVVLVWFIFYLRNNAFKNTYCLKKGMLFKQFCIIFFIFFISTTQYFSFKKGLITKIKTLYSWDEVNKDIKTFNKVALFLVQNQSDYEIDKKKYPKPFPLNVAFTDSNKLNENVDITKPFLEYKGSKFQFYEIDEELWDKNTENNNLLNEYNKYDFKYRIVKDVSEFKALLHPSLYNYSKTKFTTGQDSIESKKLLNYYQDILEKADEFSIKEELKKGIYLAQKYQIKHNLNIPEWYQLINNQPNYLLKELINVNDPNLKDVNGFYYNNNYSNNNSTFDIGRDCKLNSV